MQSTYNKNDQSFSPIYDEDWYILRYSKLALDMDDEGNAKKYYSIYTAHVLWEIDLPQLPAKGFDFVLSTQEAVRRWLFWLLDMSVPYLNSLTAAQRMLLYGNIFKKVDEQPEIKVYKQISFANSHAGSLTSNYKRTEYVDDVDYHYTLLGDLHNFNNSPESIDPDALKALQNAIHSVKNRDTDPVYEEYEINVLYQLLFLEIYQMIKDNIVIKKCRNCQKYFVVHNLNVEYCDRIAEGEEKPCSEIGSTRSFQRKLAEDYPLKIYNRSYKTHYARVKKGKMTRSQFNAWCVEAREKLNNVRAGTLSISEFEQWLKI